MWITRRYTINHSNILTHATSTRILSTQFLYSICKSKEFKVDMNEINILKVCL